MTAPLTTATTLFDPGSVIGGKYKISRMVGAGGVGNVYLATHIELETDVALKVLRPEMASRPDMVQRFQREARACVRLRSEHIARIYDVGSEQGQPFLVMEFLVGSDLARHSQDHLLDTATVADLMIQACEGLAVAHAQRTVHRDIKPENLFVVRDESGWLTLKILDFGISKIALTGKVSDVEVSSMRTEVMMGTPHYISPEQIRSTRDVDHRTDLWSLGVVMFELCSRGVMPFREESDVGSLIAEILERPHRALGEVAPHVDPELVAVIDRCLEKDVARRFQTAAEVAAALLPFAPERSRASVERASAATRAAGFSSSPDLGSSPRLAIERGPGSEPSVPRLLRTPSSDPALVASGTVSPSSSPTLPAHASAAPRAQSQLPLILLALVALLVLAVAGWLVRERTLLARPALATPSTDSATPLALPTSAGAGSASSLAGASSLASAASAPASSATPRGSADGPDGPDGPASSTARAATRGKPTVPRPVAPPLVAASSRPSSAPPGTTSLEIRHER